MIPQIQFDEKKEVRKFARATSHRFYTENERVIRELFERTLMVKDGQYPFIDVQRDLLAAILSADKARRGYRRYKRLVGRALGSLVKAGANRDRVALAQSLMEDMADGETSARWMIDRVQAIGDGVAWRVLNYDRASLRLLAEHEPVSTPQMSRGLATEIEELFRLVYGEGHPAVLNSTTNYLRVGDITVYDFDSNEIRVVEVKSGNIPTARTHRQGEYLSFVQEGLSSGTHDFKGGRIRTLQARRPLRTHIASIERAMQAVGGVYGSSRLFGDYLAVAVFDVKKATDNLREGDWADQWAPYGDRLARVRRQQNDLLTPRMGNFDIVSHFSPNIAPYAVFPIEPNLRFGLLTGQFLVVSALNISGLARWLNKRGWAANVMTPSTEDLESRENLTVPVLRVGRDGVHVNVSLTLLITAAMEFWTRESVEDYINVILDSDPSESAPYAQVVFPNYGKCAWD